jgi:putative SOS response-associated peptidase YedK
MPERNDEGRRLGLSPEQVEARQAEFDRRNRIARRNAARQPRPTIGQLWTFNPWVWLYCETPRCRHYTAIPLAPLIIRWGRNATSDMLRSGFRCSRCGRQVTSIRTPSKGSALEPIDTHRQWTGFEDWHPEIGAFSVARMCNLYSNTRSRDAIRALFHVSDNRAFAFEPMPAIFPKSVAPVVRLAADGERELVPMTWGFPLIRKGYAPKPVTNVRDDTVLTSPFWRPSFEARRCLVPASSYCEPDSNTPAGWHWFAIEPADERPLFAFPGIWKRYKGPMKKDGPEVEVDVYAFMTTTPNALTATIMHDRMPVLLSDQADFETWLSAPPEEAFRLVRTFPAERMRVVQSGSDKEDLLGVEPTQSALL